MKITDAFVKIYVASYLHPLNGRRIKPLAVPNIDQYSNLSLRFAAILDCSLFRTSSILRSSLIVAH